MKYTCLNPIASVGLDQFTEGYEKTEKMEDADAVLVRSAAMHDLELPDGLYAVARAGAGVNNIPLDKCAEKGIVVFNTPGANANGVKELVIAGMLLASRDIIGGVEWAKSEAGSEDIAKKAEKEKQLVDHSVDCCYFADSCCSRIFGTAKFSKRSCTGKTGNDQGGSCREKLCCRKSAFRKKFPRIRNIRETETASGCRYIQRVTG